MKDDNVLILGILAILTIGAAIFYHTYSESRDREENKDRDRFYMNENFYILDKKTGDLWRMVEADKTYKQLKIIPIGKLDKIAE
ncbi:MAG: hypothetical protein WAX69_05405 [Victivallales bacterium]